MSAMCAAILPDLPPMWAIPFLLIGLVFYLIPTFIAGQRRAQNYGAILGVNLVFGWTILGWIAALMWAVTDRQR